VKIGFDPWQMAELERILSDEGISLPFEEGRQGFKSMSPATKSFEERILNRQLLHDGNPLLTWGHFERLDRDGRSGE
jgi:phage terminase large subunit-like protein